MESPPSARPARRPLWPLSLALSFLALAAVPAIGQRLNNVAMVVACCCFVSANIGGLLFGVLSIVRREGRITWWATVLAVVMLPMSGGLSFYLARVAHSGG